MSQISEWHMWWRGHHGTCKFQRGALVCHLLEQRMSWRGTEMYKFQHGICPDVEI